MTKSRENQINLEKTLTDPQTNKNNNAVFLESVFKALDETLNKQYQENRERLAVSLQGALEGHQVKTFNQENLKRILNTLLKTVQELGEVNLSLNQAYKEKVRGQLREEGVVITAHKAPKPGQ